MKVIENLNNLKRVIVFVHCFPAGFCDTQWRSNDFCHGEKKFVNNNFLILVFTIYLYIYNVIYIL